MNTFYSLNPKEDYTSVNKQTYDKRERRNQRNVLVCYSMGRAGIRAKIKLIELIPAERHE